MESRGSAPWRDRTAIAGSIAFHACVLAVVALLPPLELVRGEIDEPAVVPTMVRIERREPPRPPVRPKPVVQRPPPAPVPRPRTVPRTPVVARPVVVHVVALPSRPMRGAGPARVAAKPPSIAVIVAGTPAPVAVVSAAPTPSAAPGVPSTVAEGAMGIGNLGDTWPARPMPGLLAELRAKVAGHAVLRIEVDERGRPLTVTIVSGIDDPTLREAIRAELARVHYIPARCNGLDCADTLTLAL